MKTFDKKDVFSWSNSEEAQCYVGKCGYFANTLIAVENAINLDKTHTLKEINSIHGLSFLADNQSQYSFFLPIDKVIDVEEPKKWRAYKNFDEFDYTVGDTIHLRLKQKRSSEYMHLITGFNYYENSISINGVTGNFENFFDLYEIFNGKDWQPFGVMEE